MASQVTGIDHVALVVSDLEKSLSFFCDLLGFQAKFDFDYEGIRIVILKAGKIDLEIWEDKSQPIPDAPDEPLQRMGVNHIALSVNKLEETLETMQQHGYPVIKAIYQVTRGIREAVILGPDNIEIQFVEQNIPVLLWRSVSGDLNSIRPHK